jgi:putative hydrolase of the HAD superfamily
MTDPPTDRAADAGVLFDLDGTLLTYADYEGLVGDAFRSELDRVEAAWVAHYSERFFDRFEAFAAEPYRTAFADVCDRFGLAADPAALSATLVTLECERSTVPAGVRETLADLREAGHPLGVCSNGVRRVQRAKLAAADLLAPFGVVVTSYDAGAHKPDPTVFETARETLGATSYVMVGDDDDDVAGARAAGVAPLRVDGPFPSAEAVLDAV